MKNKSQSFFLDRIEILEKQNLKETKFFYKNLEIENRLSNKRSPASGFPKQMKTTLMPEFYIQLCSYAHVKAMERHFRHSNSPKYGDLATFQTQSFEGHKLNGKHKKQKIKI